MAATTEQADKQKIAEAFRAEATGDSLPYDPSHNIAPTSTQPVLRQERETFRRAGVWSASARKASTPSAAPSMRGLRFEAQFPLESSASPPALHCPDGRLLSH